MCMYQENPVQFLGWEDPLEKGQAPTPVFLGFPGGSGIYKAEDLQEQNIGPTGSSQSVHWQIKEILRSLL